MVIRQFLTNQTSAESLSSSHLGLTDEAKVTVAVAVVEQLSDAMYRQMNLTAVLLAVTIDPVVGLTFIPVAVKNPEEQVLYLAKVDDDAAFSPLQLVFP